MNECIFCKIVRKEIPKDFIYEDDNFLAFLDIQPVMDGHVLIIPKEHVVWMQEGTDETVGGIFIVAKKLMLALKNALACDYVQVSVGGTDVPHFHVHLMPRYLNDTLTNWPTKKYKDGEEKELVEKITQAII